MGSLHGHEPGISRLAGQWFPDAAIVSGRLHVVRLVRRHMDKVCGLPDGEHVSFGCGGLMRLPVARTVETAWAIP